MFFYVILKSFSVFSLLLFCPSNHNVKDQMGKATSDLHHPTNLLLFSAAKKL
jgi:hypothetical protein